jgi:protein TonB
MEVKKSPKADLRNWKGVFLEAGLIVALVVCIVAFSISQKDRTLKVQEVAGEVVETEMVDITQEVEEIKVEPQKQSVTILTDAFDKVKNDTNIDTSFTFFENDDIIDVETIDFGQGEAGVEEPILIIADEMPSFDGGDLGTFRNWVQKNYVYPQIAVDNGIKGNVTIYFVVEKDGKVSGVRVLQSPDPILSEEAIRVVSSSTGWTPGKNRGMPVRIQYTMTISLQIGG